MSTTGLYIPPWKRNKEGEENGSSSNIDTDPASIEKQQATWAKLRTSLNGVVNRLSEKNIKPMTANLFSCNLIRGQGLLCRSIMKAQVREGATIMETN